MKRYYWTPTAHSRLCSEHFVSGQKSDNPLSPDYVPSLFKFLSPQERQQKIDDYMEFERTHRLRYRTDDTGVPTAGGTDADVEDSGGIRSHEDGSQTVEHDEKTARDESSVPCVKEEDTLQVQDEAHESPFKQEAFSDDADNTTEKRKLEMEADDGDAGPSAKISKTTQSEAKKRNRSYDRSLSLGALAKKFAELIERPNTVLDLNAIAQRLDVPKRRLYDVTNVLQGVMLLEKKSKNLMRWLGPQLTQRVKKTEIQALIQAEVALDELIEDCTSQLYQLYEDSYTHGHAYVTYEDLLAIPALKDQTVIAVKAPVETKVDVAHPEDAFRIHLCSSLGPIDVFMCCDDEVPNDAPESNLTSTSASSPKDSSCAIDSLPEPTPHSSPVSVSPHLPSAPL
ncbi:transcription factor E2F3 isoform X2 [Salarias fasciatus]|nr:transcription factor E2F6-like isoform X2 [Salarias fasciatus]